LIRAAFQAVARNVWRVAGAGFPAGTSLTRYVMHRSLKEQARKVNLGDRVLSISGSSHVCTIFGVQPQHVVEADFPEYSLCDLKLPSESFTAVVSDQVLEHVGCHPQRAIDEVYRVLVPGGIAVHTTVFQAPYHGSPDYADENNGDYWRFTPSGLMLLHRKYSKILAADGWGNPLIPVFGGLGLNRMPVPDWPSHPLSKLVSFNRRSYAFMVWVVAQK
jgi:SAM-dependent methyltransferase